MKTLIHTDKNQYKTINLHTDFSFWAMPVQYETRNY